MNYVYRIKIITPRTKNHWNGIEVGEMAEFDSCVSWSFEDEYDYDSQPQSSTDSFPNYECCLFTLPTTVKNCGDFRVYHIGPTQACSIAYCSAPEYNMPNSTVSGAVTPLRENEKTVETQVPF